MARALDELLEAYCAQERLTRLEGRQGIENLSKIAKAIGYKDEMYFGQFLGGCIGDFLEFLEDNPGVCEAIYNWIGEQNIQEWKEKLEDQLLKGEET